MNRGPSESTSKSSPLSQDSPFAIQQTPAAADAPASPFKWGGKDQWPFQDIEPLDEFGFEAPATGAVPSPFAGPAESPPAFTIPTKASPWQDEEIHQAPPQKESTPYIPPSFIAPPEFRAEPKPEAVAKPVEVTPAVPVVAPVQPETVRPPAAEIAAPESAAIRQLEMRAIFGLDREITADEILDRCRKLPRILNLARIHSADVSTIEALKTLLANLGFGNGALKLQIGAVPLDFVREGGVIFAVQTDGSFAPGVRETLILAARELGRLG